MHIDHANQPRRLFSCRQCDHRLRFDMPRCGDCYAPTPIYNRKAFWIGLALVVILAAATGALAELT